MRISVIIPTYNGAHRITGILESLKNQTVASFEVVIVIDGSEDNTEVEIRRYQELFLSFKIVRQPNAGRSNARNRGAAEATGEILIFYDDDIVADARSVEQHVTFHSNYYGLLSGNQVELISQNKTEIQNYKAFLTHKWMEKFEEGLTKLNEQTLFFTAANSSMPKNLLLSLHGFDGRLTDAEDFDLAMRALHDNIPVYFDKANLAVHNDPITCISYIKRLRQYRAARQKLRSLHPERTVTEEQLGNFKRLFYRFFSLGIFPLMIDRFNIFFVVPRRIRYKFYDVVIHSLGVVYPNVRL